MKVVTQHLLQQPKSKRRQTLGKHGCVLKWQTLSPAVKGLASLVTPPMGFRTRWDPVDLLQATSWHPGKGGQPGNVGSSTYSPPGCCGRAGTGCRRGSAIGPVRWRSGGWPPLCTHSRGSWSCLPWLSPGSASWFSCPGWQRASSGLVSSGRSPVRGSQVTARCTSE